LALWPGLSCWDAPVDRTERGESASSNGTQASVALRNGWAELPRHALQTAAAVLIAKPPRGQDVSGTQSKGAGLASCPCRVKQATHALEPVMQCC
jgi:hypothetical protein